MTTLASAVAIGDNELIIDTPLAAGQVPGFVKIGTELLDVGGADNRLGTTLVLSRPATATHSQGATVTYAGRPYDADFLTATAGPGGGGAIAVTGTEGTVPDVSEVEFEGHIVTDVGGGVVGVNAARSVTATGDGDANIASAANSVDGFADAHSVASATGEGEAIATSIAATTDGDADAHSSATADGDGNAAAGSVATSSGAGYADATSVATTVDGYADAHSGALTSGAGDADAHSRAVTSGGGSADATSIATSSVDGDADTVSTSTAPGAGIATSGIRAQDGVVEASLLVTVDGAGVASFTVVGMPTANPGAGKLWNDGGTLKVGT